VIFTLTILFILNIYLAMIVLMMVPVLYIYTKLVSKKAQQTFYTIQDLTKTTSAFANEVFEQTESLMCNNASQLYQKEFEKLTEELYQNAKRGYFKASMNNPTFRFIQNIFYCLLGLGFVILTFYNAAPQIGIFMTITMYAALFSKPLNELSGLTAQFMLGSASFERIETYQQQAKTENNQGQILPILTQAKIELRDLSYAHVGQTKVLKNLSLVINDGATVAIVGPTGAGKTSLTSLLMRFYEPNEGTILLNDVNINRYDINSYRNVFGLVLQEPWGFKASILDNILYGQPEASLDEVIRVSKLVGCHDFIEKLNLGYQTIIDDTALISMGQKQLITIARLILSKPHIYILDEATSLIDSFVDKKIQETLIEITKDTTTIIVAHRLKTIVNADKIVVIDQGEIIEVGTHVELMNKKGFYYQMFNAQFT
jgi:ABC-type multidrug transport system fused ATPase/permease subunit